MKNFVKILLGMMLLLAIGFSQGTTAQAQDKYTYGFRAAIDVPITDTVKVEIAPLNLSQTLASVVLDTSVTVNANVANSVPNDMLILKFTADSTTRAVTFGDNIQAEADTVQALKVKLWTFIFDGNEFLNTAVIQLE